MRSFRFILFGMLLLVAQLGLCETPPKNDLERQKIVAITPSPVDVGEHWQMESLNGPEKLHWVLWSFRPGKDVSPDLVYITTVSVAESAE